MPELGDDRQVDFRKLQPGELITLGDGTVVKVIENPRDGLWIRGRYVSCPNAPALEGKEDQIFASDVLST